MSHDRAANDPVAATSSATESINQIRDILFGEQMRVMEDRFAALEQRINEHQKSIHDQLHEYSENLQASIDQTVATFNDQLANERRARDKLIDELDKNAQRLRDEDNNRVSQIEADALDSFKLAKRDLKDQIEAAEVRLSSEQARLVEDMSLQNRDLQQRKVDSGELSDLLAELAIRLAHHNPSK